MEKQVVVPLADGTHRLHRLEQIWIEIAAEMMRIGKKIDKAASKATIAYAEKHLFAALDEDKTDISLYVALQIEHALRLFNVQSKVSPCDYRPSKCEPFASVKFAMPDYSAYLWLGAEEPYAVCKAVEEKNNVIESAPTQHVAPGKEHKPASPVSRVTNRRSPSPVLPPPDPSEFWKNLLGEYS